LMIERFAIPIASLKDLVDLVPARLLQSQPRKSPILVIVSKPFYPRGD
jgi:hypothetical protein